MRGTVNTFFRGSIPLDTYLITSLSPIILLYISERVEIGKQSPLKQEWK